MDSLPTISLDGSANSNLAQAFKNDDYQRLIVRINEGINQASTPSEDSIDLQDAVLKFQELLLGLKGKISDDTIVELIGKIELIRAKVSGKNIDEVLRFIPEPLREDVVRVFNDPKLQRILTQELLGYSMGFLAQNVGIHMNFVTLGGENHADVGGLFQIPYNGKKLYIFWVQGRMMMADSSEKALDAMSLAVKNPVFAYYLVDNKGNIKARVETQLSEFMRDQLFPTEKIVEGWIRKQGMIPEGVTLSLSTGNTGKRVTLSKKNADTGLFILLGISESEIGTLKVSSENITLGWSYTGKNNTFTIYTTKSRVHFSNPEFQAADGWSIGTFGDTTIYKDDEVRFGLSRWSHLALQSTGNDWRHPQTAEIRGGISLDGEFPIGSNTHGGFSIKRNGFWAPNVFPNTFDHINSSERRYLHFLGENGYSARIQHILGGRKSISLDFSHMQGSYSATQSEGFQYGSNGMKMSFSHSHTRSMHPLISSKDETVLEVRRMIARSVEISLRGSHIRYGSQSQKQVSGSLVIQIP
ncbi:MAG: hypothetical protein HHAS10_04760 [Candidatus Altimarinota bacterium]